MQLYDMQGRLRYGRQLGMLPAGGTFIDLAEATTDLASGPYVLRLVADGKVLHQKVIKYRL